VSTEGTESSTDQKSAETIESSTDQKGSRKKLRTKRPKNPRRRIAIAVVIVVVVVAAGAGLWRWHEQPSFCGAVCHTPMASYYDTYTAKAGQPTTDKYGNAVTNSNAMLVTLHAEAGDDCLSCHVPTLQEQFDEGIHWITGNYYSPLKERGLTDLMLYHGATTDEESKGFCINASCHSDLSDPATFAALTSSYAEWSPHQPPVDFTHSNINPSTNLLCSNCHKSHRASTNYCTSCHNGVAPLPEGWVSYSEARKLLGSAASN